MCIRDRNRGGKRHRLPEGRGIERCGQGDRARRMCVDRRRQHRQHRRPLRNGVHSLPVVLVLVVIGPVARRAIARLNSMPVNKRPAADLSRKLPFCHNVDHAIAFIGNPPQLAPTRGRMRSYAYAHPPKMFSAKLQPGICFTRARRALNTGSVPTKTPNKRKWLPVASDYLMWQRIMNSGIYGWAFDLSLIHI